MTKVSVIVPVYNTEKYLKKCIDSILNQTFKDIEIILVDDASTDNSLSIMLEYEWDYPNKIKVISSENNGPGGARNIGFDASKGEYILFVDSDDFLLDDMIEILYKHAILNNADIVRCANQIYFENIYLGKYNLDSYSCNNETVINPSEEINYVFNEIPNVWNKLIRRDLFKDIRFRKHMRWEDGPVIRPVCALAKSIVYLKDSKYVYRANLRNTTLTDFYKPSSKILDVFQGMDDLEENFRKIHKYDEFEKIIKTDQIFSIMLRVQNAGLWFKLSNEDRILLTNYLVNLIEIKYGDWVDNKLYVDYKLRSKFFRITMEYIEKSVLNEKLRQESNEDKIYKNVREIFKSY